MFSGITCFTKNTIKTVTNLHHPDHHRNIFLFSTPRSGSTWLMELIWSQPGFKACNEPLDVRNPMVRRYSGIASWLELYNRSAVPVVQRYIQALCEGRLHSMDPVPFRGFYRPVTHRIVFKIINGCEDRINWFRDTFNGQIVYLIRHPIAVGLSREYLPRVQAQLESDYRLHFTQEQIDFAHHIMDNGSKLEQGVLSWCLENTVPLRMATDDWLIIGYEELVINPETVIARLAQHLSLPEPGTMLSRVAVPSSVKTKSNRETQQALEWGANRRWLVGKWRNHISEREERRAMEILAHFRVDVYRYGETLPSWQSLEKHSPSNH